MGGGTEGRDQELEVSTLYWNGVGEGKIESRGGGEQHGNHDQAALTHKVELVGEELSVNTTVQF